MSSSTEYINAYLENSISTLHDYLNQILQLKTQLKLVTDSISSKDAVLDELSKELERVKDELDSNKKSQEKDNEAINTAKLNAERLQNENDSIKHRLGEFDALVKQFADLKNEYKNKNIQYEKLSSELENVKTLLVEKDRELKELEKLVPKKSISSAKKSLNTKNTTMQDVAKPIDENDDF